MGMKSKEAIVHCGKLGKLLGRVLDVNTPSLWGAAKRSSSEVIPPVRRLDHLPGDQLRLATFLSSRLRHSRWGHLGIQAGSC
jgi:hypothetical protein